MGKKQRKSKQDKVLDYFKKDSLKEHSRGLTQAMAIDKFKAYRLSSIVHRLKRQKYNIITNIECTKNEDGSISRFARYFLI